MPALQEISNFLQELVSKPTGFWNKLTSFYILSLFPCIPRRIAAMEGTALRSGSIYRACGHNTNGGFFMKKSALFLLGTLIVGMAFSLVLAGCASTEGTEDPMAAAQAEQLAADINKISAEGATVNSATVTLTNEVRLETALTVPAGVTLDLTKEALQLANNATLTVNGTVNAKAEGINIDSAAESPAAINGSGTIQLKSKGRLLGIWEGKKLILDGVTLVGLKDNNNPVVEMGNGGEFVMKSGKITGNAIEEGWAFGGGVRVDEGSTFAMSGGVISGNAAKNGGGGVAVTTNSTFTMSGGTISDNTAEGGGGVIVAINSTFTMSDGAISGNTAAEGGGVRLFSGDNKGGGTFIMEGGSIAGNTAEYGGGVNVSESTFTLKGGRISGNNTTGSEASEGGGVVMWKGTFTMEGGEISENTTKGGEGSSGGGVQVGEESVFIMKGGTISGNSSTGGDWADGGGVDVWQGTFTMKGGTISGNTATSKWAGGVGVTVEDGAAFTMEGGAISGNSANGSQQSIGGGVFVDNGTFIMTGGRVQGGTASDGFAANTLAGSDKAGAALNVDNNSTTKWGTGGTYTKGGLSQAGGGSIVEINDEGWGCTDDTLIATPAP
jgi:outer membrane murein-binding lipoprotein Lpp